MPRPARPSRALPRVARYTWSRQWPAVALFGFALGIVNLAPFAVKRSLGGGDEIVPLLIALWQGLWILSPAVGPLLTRADPQRTWRRIAVLAYAPLALVAFVWVRPTAGEPGHGVGNLALFLVALFCHYTINIAYIPHRGALIRANYAPEVRGRMYAMLGIVTLVAAAIAAKVGGWLLDGDPRRLRVLFPAAALLGGAGFWLQGRIRWRGQRRARAVRHGRVGPLEALRAAWREAFRILREDRAFRVYEIAFMLYGFGFLMSWALVVLYAESGLGLSYDAWTWAQGVAGPLAHIGCMAVWGRLADRFGVVRTTAAAFFLLALFMLVMTRVQSGLDLALAYVVFGAAMSGVDVGWSLGPLHFAREGEAHMYGAVHFSLVGVRSLFAPFLGYLMLTLVSFQAGFLLAAAFVFAGSLTAARLARRVMLSS